MRAWDTAITVAIGAGGVAVAAAADALGASAVGSSLTGLAVVIALLGLRRALRSRS